MRSILGGFGPITPEERPPPKDLSPDELEKLVSQALQKLLREGEGVGELAPVLYRGKGKLSMGTGNDEN